MEWGGNTFTEHPASSGASLSPYKPSIAIVTVKTRNTRPRVVQSLVKVTQPGSGGVGSESRASWFLAHVFSTGLLRFAIVWLNAAAVTYGKYP